MKLITFRETEEFKARLDKASRVSGISISNIIRMALNEYLSKLGF